VLAGIVEVKMHLTGIGVREFSKFQVDHHQAAQLAMEEEQIDAIPLVANA
jgi:hypothetical protein